MTADIANPMFKTMLPGPLASLHFTKVDFGTVPMRVSNVKATKTDSNGISLDLNLEWNSKSDIQLDANMIPTLVRRNRSTSHNQKLIEVRALRVLVSKGDSPFSCAL